MQHSPVHPHHACLKVSTLAENPRTHRLQSHLSHIQRSSHSKACLPCQTHHRSATSLHSVIQPCHAITPSSHLLHKSPRPLLQLHCPRLWNSLPPHLRLPRAADTSSPSEAKIALSKQTFHSRLKTHLFSQSYPSAGESYKPAKARPPPPRD